VRPGAGDEMQLERAFLRTGRFFQTEACMGGSVRMYGAEGIYFVTARTLQGRLLLRPSTQVQQLIGGILARASRRYGVRLRGYVFMSNHLHLLVRARGCTLSAFMQFLLANIARKVGALHGWHGTFWARRFSCEPVLDAGAELQRLRYILAHGVKEGLVAHTAEWPGLTCLAALRGHRERFPFYNWDWRWQRAHCRGLGRWSPRLVEEEVLEVEPISAWASCSEETRCFLVAELVDRLAAEYRLSRGAKRPLGARAVKRQSPTQPLALERRVDRPRCHASNPLVRYQWARVYADFVAAYREASARFRKGERGVRFPSWCFSPPPGSVAGEAEGSAPRPFAEQLPGKRVAQHVFDAKRERPRCGGAPGGEGLATGSGEDLDTPVR